MGDTVEAVLLIAGFVVGAFVFIGGLIWLAMWVEGWRMQRGVARLARGLEGARRPGKDEPGAEGALLVGRRAGFDVSLCPASFGTAQLPVGTAAPMRGKILGHQLIVRAPGLRGAGRGELAALRGELVTRGEVRPPRDARALAAALRACQTTLTVSDGEVRAPLDLHLSASKAAAAIALVDAVAGLLVASGTM